MKIALTLSTFLLTLCCLAQKAFLPGYVIDNEGRRAELLIMDVGALYNPTEITFKLSEQGIPTTLPVDQIRELGFVGISKYHRFTVTVDTSSSILSWLSKSSIPEFREETALLKILIEGQITLYYYASPIGIRYFYKIDSGPVEQLVYKKYLIGIKVATNSYFRAQLRTLLKCERLSSKVIADVSYFKSELIRVFIKYHKCHRKKYVNYDKPGG